MESIQKKLKAMAERWNLTTHDVDPWILTPREEDEAMEHAINQAKQHYRFRLRLLLSEGAIEQRIAETDWDKKVDRETVLNTANSNKNHAVWVEAERVRKKLDAAETETQLRDLWTAKHIFHFMKQNAINDFGRKLIVNEHTSPLITAICFFLTKDARFETELKFGTDNRPGDLKKGLLLRGISGVGKTFLFRCVANNPISPVDIYSMLTIAKTVKKEGECNLPYYRDRKIYLDDVGTEEADVKHYGNSVTWFKEYIELYYSENKPFNNLVFSTNNSFDELENKYGFRVRSRIKDMFNIINVTGKDLRGQ